MGEPCDRNSVGKRLIRIPQPDQTLGRSRFARVLGVVRLYDIRTSRDSLLKLHEGRPWRKIDLEHTAPIQDGVQINVGDGEALSHQIRLLREDRVQVIEALREPRA